MKLLRNQINGKFITQGAYKQAEYQGRLALGIFLLIGIIMSFADALISLI